MNPPNEETLREIIKRRDGLDDAGFDAMLDEFQDAYEPDEDPEELLQNVFGIEPDFLFDKEIMAVMDCWEM